MKYNKLLLDELRFVTYKKGAIGLTDELLEKAVTLNQYLDANIHLFSGRYNFASVETCYVGMLGLGNTLPNTDEANCFFKHNLRQDCTKC